MFLFSAPFVARFSPSLFDRLAILPSFAPADRLKWKTRAIQESPSPWPVLFKTRLGERLTAPMLEEQVWSMVVKQEAASAEAKRRRRARIERANGSKRVLLDTILFLCHVPGPDVDVSSPATLCFAECNRDDEDIVLTGDDAPLGLVRVASETRHGVLVFVAPGSDVDFRVDPLKEEVAFNEPTLLMLPPDTVWRRRLHSVATEVDGVPVFDHRQNRLSPVVEAQRVIRIVGKGSNTRIYMFVNLWASDVPAEEVRYVLTETGIRAREGVVRTTIRRPAPAVTEAITTPSPESPTTGEPVEDRGGNGGASSPFEDSVEVVPRGTMGINWGDAFRDEFDRIGATLAGVRERY